MNRSIAFITCYIGKLPWYFDYFVHTCSFNSSIDFIVISDDNTWLKPLPPNVKLLYATLHDLTQKASVQLGLRACIPNGYKLCDFKPAYGVIFGDLLAGYDFWGHCDIDIVFGDIREFITDQVLEAHDLVSVRHDWLTGCFLLYKNSPFVNNLFTYSPDHKKVFTTEKHYCFDETNFAHDAFTDGKTFEEIKTEIESMTHVVKKLEQQGRLNPFFDFLIIEGVPGKLRWENGKMYYRNKYEILFYHMIYFKRAYTPVKPFTRMPPAFSITPTKILHHRLPVAAVLS